MLTSFLQWHFDTNIDNSLIQVGIYQKANEKIKSTARLKMRKRISIKWNKIIHKMRRTAYRPTIYKNRLDIDTHKTEPMFRIYKARRGHVLELAQKKIDKNWSKNILKHKRAWRYINLAASVSFLLDMEDAQVLINRVILDDLK